MDGSMHAPLRPNAVLDAVGADPREGEVLHDLFEELRIYGLDGGQGVGRQLNRPSKSPELVRLLDHLHLHMHARE